MVQNQTPAINELSDLEELAKETLKDFMKGFGEAERFFDPLLDWTLDDKPVSQIEILLVTNYWDDLKEKNKNQPYEKAKGCITKTASYPDDVRKATASNEETDQTLLNLVHPLSPWRKALAKDGNAAAVNQAWGLKKRPKEKIDFRRTLPIFGNTILLLRKAGAPLSHVILTGGDWPFTAQQPLCGTNQGVPASAYYLRWFIKDWLQPPTSSSTTITDDMIDQKLVGSFRDSYDVCKKLAEDSHEVRFWPHPSKWSYLDSTIYVPPR